MFAMQRRRSLAIFALLLGLVAQPAAGQKLSNQAFQLEFDATGIRSLRRTSDVHSRRNDRAHSRPAARP